MTNKADNPGLTPPHDTQIEQALLGAMMLDSECQPQVAGLLSAKTFYDPRHAAIYAAIASLSADRKAIDLYTVTSELRQRKALTTAGGAAYIAELTTRIGSGAHAMAHARVIYQLFVLRTMIDETRQLVGKCYDCDFDGMVADYSATITRMDSLFVGSGADKHIREILKRHGKVIDERIARAAEGGIQGVSYGLSRLDAMTNGARPDQLVIVAARPAMGKTALAIKFAMSAASTGHQVTIASLEMSDISLTDRLVGTYAGVDTSALRSGRMRTADVQAYGRAVGQLEKLEISIYDTPGTSVSRLSAMARTKHRKGELDMLIIDYLQLIETDNDGRGYRGNRDREVADISRGLKKLAIELHIPVLLLCQLNRAVESRQDKQPQLYDLRESGSIEQDADIVIMPFRPAYYGDDFVDDNGEPMPADLGILYVRKNRDGKTGEVAFRYSADLSKISDYDDPTPNDAQSALPY